VDFSGGGAVFLGRRPRAAPQRHVGQLIDSDPLSGQGVFEVGAGVGDLIGQVHELALQRGGLARVELLADRRVVRRVVLGQALADNAGQVQPAELRVGVLQVVHDAERLAVVLESAVVGHQLVQRRLARVPERRVPQIVRQRNRLQEVLVEAQGPPERARDLRDLERVRQAGPEVIVLVRHEDLRLEVEAAEGGAVDDAVAVSLEAGSVGVRIFADGPAAAVGLGGGVVCQSAALVGLVLLSRGLSGPGGHDPSLGRDSSCPPRMRCSCSFWSVWGITRTWLNTGRKFVSPCHRGTTCM